MKKILLLTAVLASSLGYSQVTIFEDSFETYTDFVISFSPWQTLDLDLLNTYTGGNPTPTWANAGVPQAFQIFNPTTAAVTNATNGVAGETENRNFNPRTGSKYAACWAGVPESNGQTGVLANNDWLVSPPISLVGATGSALSIWVKSMSDSYGLEKYRIGVYIGSGTPTGTADFTIISGIPNLTAPYGVWTERTQSLSAYDGQTIRVGIQVRTADAYMFMTDDFKVTAATLSTKDFVTNKFAVSPNPAKDVISISNNENILINGITISDLNGRIVKQLNYTDISGVQINVSDLEAGMYIMNIESDLGTATKKIIKN